MDPLLKAVGLLESGAPRAVAAAELRKFGLDEATTEATLDAAYARLAGRPEVSSEARKEILRNCLARTYAGAVAAKSFTAAVAAIDKLAKLDGLYAPVRSEINVNEQQSVFTSDPDRIRARIRELLRKHPEYVLAPPPVPDIPQGEN